MQKHKFPNNETYLPLSMQQFTALIEEFYGPINKLAGLTEPNTLSGDYLTQIVMSAIHALDHKNGIIRKNELFESVVNRISCHVTYHASEAVRKKLTPQAPEDNNVTPINPEQANSEASPAQH